MKDIDFSKMLVEAVTDLAMRPGTIFCKDDETVIQLNTIFFLARTLAKLPKDQTEKAKKLRDVE